MGIHRLTIELPEDSYNLLRSVVDSGQFASESDVISESLAAVWSPPTQEDETLDSWMLHEVLPAIEEYDADPSSGFTPEQLHGHLTRVSLNWPNES